MKLCCWEFWYKGANISREFSSVELSSDFCRCSSWKHRCGAGHGRTNAFNSFSLRFVSSAVINIFGSGLLLQVLSLNMAIVTFLLTWWRFFQIMRHNVSKMRT